MNQAKNERAIIHEKTQNSKKRLDLISQSKESQIYRNEILFATALIANPIADTMVPIIVTVLKPYFLINALATGPAPVDMP